MKRAVLTLLSCVATIVSLPSCEVPVAGRQPDAHSLLDPPLPLPREIPPPRNAQYGRDEDYYAKRPYHRPPGDFPVAKKTRPQGYVISPYTRHKIPVQGIPSGARVLEPSVNKVFINP